MLEAKKISKIYNINWLKTEYQHAIIASLAASKWVDIQKTKQALPYLQYDTAGDDKVRPEHAAMDGITLPVDDPFWKAFYPPNGWNCRCTVRKIAGGNVTPKDEINYPSEKAVPESFRYNIGDKMFIFPPNHSFYKVNPEIQNSILSKAKIEFKKFIYDLPIEAQFFNISTNPKGNRIMQHLLYDASRKDYNAIQTLASELASEGEVLILPEISAKEELNRKRIMPKVKGDYNPDLCLVIGKNRFYYDAKEPNNHDSKAISKLINKGTRQGEGVGVFLKDEIDLDSLQKRIEGKMRMMSWVREIIVFDKNLTIVLRHKKGDK